MQIIIYIKNNGRGLILDFLFLLAGLSLFLFYKNMLFFHVITIFLMIIILVKSYYQGMKNGLIWLSLVIFPMIMSMVKDQGITRNELSEILLIIGPSITVGLLAERQRRYIKRLKEAYVSTLKALAEATDAKDSYTQGHSERVAKYAVLIAKEMTLPDSELNYLEQASLLHDIGKIAMPDTILHKKEPLNEEEWLVMKKHPEYSQKILSKLSFLSQILPTVLYHHKRFDNSGYPSNEDRKDIPLTARILAVADAFDAMTSDRPYRSKLSLQQALEEIEKYAGTQFDPNVVKAFKRVKLI